MDCVPSDTASLPQVAYKTVSTHPDFDLRDYERGCAVQLDIRGMRAEATRRGFNALSRFITGSNAGAQRYAMMAPVLQQPVDWVGAPNERDHVPHPARIWRLTFFLPPGHAPEQICRPHDPRICVVTMPQRRLAVRAFSGRWSDRSLIRHGASLDAGLDAAGYRTHGPLVFAFFDAPDVSPPRRRNEVLRLLDAPSPGVDQATAAV